MFQRPSLAEESYFRKLNAELQDRMRLANAFSVAARRPSEEMNAVPASDAPPRERPRD
jgi:hypothetical protein